MGISLRATATLFLFIKRTWSSVLGQRSDDLIEGISIDGVHGPTAVNADDVDFVLSRRLEYSKLAVDHGGAHVVALALGDALQQHLLGSVEVDEVDLESRGKVRRDADDVAVLTLQGGAGDDDTVVAERELLEGLFAQASEPVPTVGIGERNTIAHLLNILWGVELFG